MAKPPKNWPTGAQILKYKKLAKAYQDKCDEFSRTQDEMHKCRQHTKALLELHRELGFLGVEREDAYLAKANFAIKVCNKLFCIKEPK